MSYFDAGDVNLDPAFEMLSKEAEEMSYSDVGPVYFEPNFDVMSDIMKTGGAAVIGGGLTVAAGVVSAGGWALYASGKMLYYEAQRAKRETEEREAKEKIRRNQRICRAKEQRKQMKDRCRELHDLWKELLSSAGKEKEVQETVEQALELLGKIQEKSLKEEPEEMEFENGKDMELLRQISSQVETAVKNHLTMKERDRMREQTEKLLDKMQQIALETVVSGQDVKGLSVEEERKRRLRQKVDDLLAEVQFVREREAVRQSPVSLDEKDKTFLAFLFQGLEEKEALLLGGALSAKETEACMDDIRHRLYQYDVKAAELNEKQDNFLTTYSLYLDACRLLGEEPVSMEELKSCEHLESLMSEKEKRIAHMEKCAALCKKVGRSAYISMALDEEMKKLGYQVADRETAQKYIHTPYPVWEEDGMVYFQLENGTLIQIYKVTERVYVQVMVKPDGMTSMETFTTDEMWKKEDVIEDQRSHCGRNEKLKEALKENWFLLSGIEEEIPPEIVVLRKAMKSLIIQKTSASVGGEAGAGTEAGKPGYQVIK